MHPALKPLGILAVLALAAAAVSYAHQPYINDSECSFHAVGGTYAGPASLTEARNGSVHAHCHADLVGGAGVEIATLVPVHLFAGAAIGTLHCMAVVTPSGYANVSCHRFK